MPVRLCLLALGSGLAVVCAAPVARGQGAPPPSDATVSAPAPLPDSPAETVPQPAAPPAPEPVAAPATEAPAVPAPPTPEQRAWAQRYGNARIKLFEGEFHQCSAMFGELGATATDETQRLLAREHGALCAAWSRQDVVLVPRTSYQETAIAAKAEDRRTTDEISILYLNSVVYGLGTGAWVDALSEPDNAAGAVLPPLLFAGGAAGLVAWVDSGRGLRYGVPQTIVTGMYIGLQEGIAWSLWNQARVERDDEWEGSTVATIIWGSSTAGAVAGGIVGSLAGTTPGRASFIGSTALWSGTVAGLLTAAVDNEDDYQDDHALLAVALGLNAGTVAGALAAGPVSPSIARVRYLDLGAISGGLLLGGLAVAAEAEGQSIAGLSALGISGGLALAWSATSSMAPDRLDGRPSAQPVAESSSMHVSVAPGRAGGSLTVSGNF